MDRLGQGAVLVVLPAQHVQVRPRGLASEVDRGGDEVQVRQMQPAELGHPHAGGVEGLHDEAVPGVAAGVDQADHFLPCERHRRSFDPASPNQAPIHHRSLRPLAAIEAWRQEAQFVSGAERRGHGDLGPAPGGQEAYELDHRGEDAVDCGRRSGRSERDEIGVGGPPAVPARAVFAARRPFQPASECRQVLDPWRGLVDPDTGSPRQVQGETAGVGAGCAHRPAFTVEKEPEIFTGPVVFDVGVVDHRPALSSVDR